MSGAVAAMELPVPPSSVSVFAAPDVLSVSVLPDDTVNSGLAVSAELRVMAYELPVASAKFLFTVSILSMVKLLQSVTVPPDETASTARPSE